MVKKKQLSNEEVSFFLWTLAGIYYSFEWSLTPNLRLKFLMGEGQNLEQLNFRMADVSYMKILTNAKM